MKLAMTEFLRRYKVSTTSKTIDKITYGKGFLTVAYDDIYLKVEKTY